MISDPGIGPYPPGVLWDLDVGPRGNSRSVLAAAAAAAAAAAELYAVCGVPQES